MVELFERQANLEVPSHTPLSLLSVRFHSSILVSYLKQGQLHFAFWLLATINPFIAFPSCGGPPSKFPDGSKSMKEVTLYVDLLICTFCRGSKMTGYFPFPSRVGLSPRYGLSFCIVCTLRPRRSPVSRSVKLSPKAHFPNMEATPRTIRPIMLLSHHCPCN